MKNNIKSYIEKRNLINRIYDMLEFFNFANLKFSKDNDVKIYITNNIKDEYFVESLAKYFYVKLRKSRKKVELRSNLWQLINDLDYLKQYIEKDKLLKTA